MKIYQFLILLILSCWTFNYSESQADQYYDTARWLYVAGDMAGALKNCQEVLKLEPTHERAQKLLAKLKEPAETKANTSDSNFEKIAPPVKKTNGASSKPMVLEESAKPLPLTNSSPTMLSTLNESTTNLKPEVKPVIPQEVSNTETPASLKSPGMGDEVKKVISKLLTNQASQTREEASRAILKNINLEISNTVSLLIRDPNLQLWIKEQVSPIAERLVFEEMQKTILEVRDQYGFMSNDTPNSDFTNRLQMALRQGLETITQNKIKTAKELLLKAQTLTDDSAAAKSLLLKAKELDPLSLEIEKALSSLEKPEPKKPSSPTVNP